MVGHLTTVPGFMQHVVVCLQRRQLALFLLHLCAACCCPCSADGLAQQYLTSLAKLKASKDCVLGLAATLSLWYLSAEDANPCYLASVAAAVLVDQLLQVGWPDTLQCTQQAA
jgi:hypothetical protein